MNARKIIGILGGIIALLIATVVAFALWSIKKLESEKNANRTAKAREARHKPKAETQAEPVGELKIVHDAETQINEATETENQQ
jgi:hypothetical protein